LFTVLDVLGGVLAAQAVTIGLLHRCINKVGGKVTSSLMSAATLLLADDLAQHYAPSDDEPVVSAGINGVYATQHGLLALDCTKMALLNALGMTASSLEDWQSLLLKKTAEQWVEQLAVSGIACAVVIENLNELSTQTLLQPSLESGSYTKVISPWFQSTPDLIRRVTPADG
jgi:crotonobetainyl-CoA:carnitine CoA-transferase CaiB-like acyl-CoA transferase